MTNKEEVIKHLILLKESAVKSHNDTGIINVKLDSFNFVMDMAIKALEQQSMPTMVYPQVEGITPVVVEPIPKLPPVKPQPCKDAISRQAVDEIKELMTDINGDTVYAVRMSDIRQLPSVKPQEPKTGHWILADEQNKEDVENDNYRFICSECQCSDIHAKGTIVPYCWKCGRHMVDEQESEDKE